MTAIDTHADSPRLLETPAEHGFSITPHDTNELAYVTRAIYVGGAGDITFTTKGGESVTLKAVPVGTVLPIRAKLVTTATTATFLVGLY
jgi:hypothetical protein